MVRTEGADKRGTARFLAFGVNGLSVALMVVVFSHTAGLTGAEVGIAGGGRPCSGQKLLEAVFGDQAVPQPRRARPASPLDVRVAELVDGERPGRSRPAARGGRPEAPRSCAWPRAGRRPCATPPRCDDALRWAPVLPPTR